MKTLFYIKNDIVNLPPLPYETGTLFFVYGPQY
jgi:hypothetical protein